MHRSVQKVYLKLWTAREWERQWLSKYNLRWTARIGT